MLDQILSRFRVFVSNPQGYNRRVLRLLPLEFRVGRIRRLYTWPKDAKPLLLSKALLKLQISIRKGANQDRWMGMTLNRYLGVAALAYDTVFPGLRRLSALQKYKKKADGRDGGMLALSGNNLKAFERWYRSDVRMGCHPWEILCGHPHGILLAPVLEKKGWRFSISVDSPGHYLASVRMATKMGQAGIPFVFFGAQEVISTLRGEDEVEVGPFRGQVPLGALVRKSKETLGRVCWAPIKELREAREPLRLV